MNRIDKKISTVLIEKIKMMATTLKKKIKNVLPIFPENTNDSPEPNNVIGDFFHIKRRMSKAQFCKWEKAICKEYNIGICQDCL